MPSKPRVKDLTSVQRLSWAQIKGAVQSAELYDRVGPYFFVRGIRRDGQPFDYEITPAGYVIHRRRGN